MVVRRRFDADRVGLNEAEKICLSFTPVEQRSVLTESAGKHKTGIPPSVCTK